MVSESVGIPEGGLLLKNLMLAEACSGAIKDVSAQSLFDPAAGVFDDETPLLQLVCSAFPNPAVILGNG